ncbi:MAG: carbohydrate-binding family 9-like protein [Bacteroidales bacterium]|nr:carbohydrate-binding family 9-like protein [Bacteroidales bacterium]
MKNLSINFLTESTPHEAAHVPQILDAHATEWHTIGCCNWAETYPYKPKAEFRLACTDEALLLHYRVEEDSIRALCAEDNGRVWTDSCMEMFLSPCPEDGSYYNLECNCIGTVLLGYHDADGNKSRAAYDVTAGISRWASLGRSPFAERETEGPWEVALIVPFACYWRHAFRPEAGTQMRGNFYKCGDELRTPHFLSWAPIEWERPNFHLPQFFGQLRCQ